MHNLPQQTFDLQAQVDGCHPVAPLLVSQRSTMAITLKQSFYVKAPVDTVWRFLLDPEQVVACMPGAALDEVVAGDTFLGNIKVKFCGAKAKVPGGPATLALRTGARIIPAAMVRTKGNRFTTYFDKPLNFEPTGDFAHDVQALTQKIMDSMELKVRAYPDQWFMFRRIWV